ncbi:hypothetical protein E1H18_4274 [Caulobacter sp. RHG1]|nr:hypothetical protein [Caulobacter sp. RHG1]
MSAAPISLGRHRDLTLAYGAAHFGKSLFWNCGTLLLAFFLTEVAGLSPLAMGAVLAGSLLLSAATDVIIGRLLHRRLSHPLSAGSLQVWGCIFVSLALLGLFAAPLAPAALRFGWVLAALLALRVSYSVYDTPQNALMTLATHDSSSRSRVAALRVAVSGLAALILAAGVLPLLASGAFSAPRQRIMLFVALGGAMAMIGLCTAIWLRWALSRVDLEHVSPSKAQSPVDPKAARAGAPMVELLPLYGIAFAFPFAMSAFAKLEPYYVAYVLASPVWAGALAIAGSSGVLLSQLAWGRVLRRLGRRWAFICLSFALLASAVVFGLSAQTAWKATIAAGLIGVASGGLNMLIWSTVADEAAARGREQVGLIYGVFTAVSKTAPAVSGLGLGVLLGQFDYRATGSDGLILLISGFPILGALACAGIALFWRERPAP